MEGELEPGAVTADGAAGDEDPCWLFQCEQQDNGVCGCLQLVRGYIGAFHHHTDPRSFLKRNWGEGVE